MIGGRVNGFSHFGNGTKSPGRDVSGVSVVSLPPIAMINSVESFDQNNSLNTLSE